MASKLQIKKSNETGKVPQPADLDWGELAINYTDGKLFYKQNGSNSIQEINTPATGAAAHKTWASLGSNGAAARRHTIARVYGTPNHWTDTWQNIRIKLIQEGYSSGYLEYNLIGYYGMGNGASWILRLKDADGLETGNFQVTLGTPTAAGWDYAGQPTYYQDVYVEVAYYLTVRVVATTYGHGFQTANPTDGSNGCYTVFYTTPDITDGITYSTVLQNSTYHLDNKIWNAGNDGSGSGLDADLLDGNHASAFYLASNPSGYTSNTGTVTSVGGTGTVSGLTLSGTVTGSGNLTLGGAITGFLPTTGGTVTGAITVSTNATGTIATFEGPTGRYIYTGTDGLGHYIEQIGTAAAERVLRFQNSNGSGTYTQFFIDGANQRIYTSSNVNVGIGTATPAYKLEVAGSFAATTKSFVIPHPTKSNKKLRYGSLEGPENGVYVRGRLRGIKIQLPDYWTKLVDPDSITVQLTPHGRRQDIWVTKIENNCVYVQGTTQPDCYYFIQAERIDVAKLEVECE